jgi:hypothetical protein
VGAPSYCRRLEQTAPARVDDLGTIPSTVVPSGASVPSWTARLTFGQSRKAFIYPLSPKGQDAPEKCPAWIPLSINSGRFAAVARHCRGTIATSHQAAMRSALRIYADITCTQSDNAGLGFAITTPALVSL